MLPFDRQPSFDILAFPDAVYRVHFGNKGFGVRTVGCSGSRVEQVTATAVREHVYLMKTKGMRLFRASTFSITNCLVTRIALPRMYVGGKKYCSAHLKALRPTHW